ncbi:MAG TPA: MBL fold metallo-hydrolase [Chryseosolibacter sp.]|nr:MBL fold metallo-hydrolase [Chryseosolibacter sp.]
MLQIKSFVFNPFQENTYVLYDETGECVIVDPGCYEPSEELELKSFIDDNKLTVKYLLNTHCHIDHVLGNYFVKNTFGVKFLMHAADEPVLRAVKVYAPNYGMVKYSETLPDSFLEEGDVVTFGTQALKVLFVPGHAPGHIAFYQEGTRTLISGDVLFYNSIGRTDLPGGNYSVLINSIHQKLFTLPDAVIVYPGHGPETTIGHEKKTNPFCAIA